MPTHTSVSPPRDSRRWRQAAHRGYSSSTHYTNGSENRRYLWLLAATVAVVLGLVGILLIQALPEGAPPANPATIGQQP